MADLYMISEITCLYMMPLEMMELMPLEMPLLEMPLEGSDWCDTLELDWTGAGLELDWTCDTKNYWCQPSWCHNHLI